MTRRSYGLTLLACLAGAGIALYAVTRSWSVEVTPRTGMSDVRTVRTGADVAPWVVGLALVALAGTGALLATGGWVRRVLGVALALAGAAIAAGASVARVGLSPGAAGAGGTVWPIACALGGAIIAGGGLSAARLGHRWPRMSSRYERRPVRPPPRGESSPGAGVDPAQPADHRAAWDALDRGDDPTT